MRNHHYRASRAFKSAFFCSTSVGLVLAASMAGAQAQQTAQSQAAAGGIEEIVVTATRREETLSKVPISIAAFSTETLETQDVKTLNDLQRQIPSLTFNGNTVAIRGIGSNAGSATTGVYVDETPIQILGFGYGLQNPVPLIFDLDRIEVLRGPQGTLFGGGAEGGVVRYITPAPSLTKYSGFAKAEVGFIQNGAENTELGFAYGGPIIQDKLGFRISADQLNTGGWVDQLGNWTHQLVRKNANNGMQRVFRLALAWAVSDNFTVTPSFHYQETQQFNRQTGNNIATQSVFYSNPSKGVFQDLVVGAYEANDRWYLPALKLEYDTSAAHIISNTSVIVFKHKSLTDPTWLYSSYISPSSYLPGVNVVATDGFHLPPGVSTYQPLGAFIDKSRVFTQEIRAQSADTTSPFQWVAGAYYTNSRNFNMERDEDPGGNLFILKATGFNTLQYYGYGNICDEWGCDVAYKSPFTVNSSDLAAFGEASYNVTDQLKLTVGLRETHSKFSFKSENDGSEEGTHDFGAGSSTANSFTPKFNISFQLDSDNMFYGTIAKGFRNGGANGPLPAATCGADLANIGYSSTPPSYGPDTTWSYEVGSKNRLFDGDLTLDSNAYLIKWKNIQTRISLPCTFALVLNTGEVTAKGFETAANARIGDSVSVNVAVGYMHGVYTKGPTAAPGAKPSSTVGDRLTDPDWKVSAGLQYNTDFAERPVFARIDYQLSHIADAKTITTDPLNASYDVNIPRQNTTGYFTARAGVTIENLDLSLFIDNLMNSTKRINLSHQKNRAYYTFTTWRPRTFTLQAKYKF